MWGVRGGGGRGVYTYVPKSGMGWATLAFLLMYSQSAIFVYRCSLDRPCSCTKVKGQLVCKLCIQRRYMYMNDMVTTTTWSHLHHQVALVTSCLLKTGHYHTEDCGGWWSEYWELKPSYVSDYCAPIHTHCNHGNTPRPQLGDEVVGIPVLVVDPSSHLHCERAVENIHHSAHNSLKPCVMAHQSTTSTLEECAALRSYVRRHDNNLITDHLWTTILSG